MMGSLLSMAQMGRSHHTSTVGEEVLGKKELACQLCGPWLTPGPLASLQEYLPWPGLAPGVPLAPGRLHTILSQPPPSASSGPKIFICH